ncbi:MAG: hypothetical protein QG593_557, partial [Patescibacteria group bacterium]|nr:hypothetical protein [Patescibacteria group bacterium]
MLNTIDADKYDYFINNLKYFETIYMVPPWEEIFCQNEERKHSFKKSVEDFRRLLAFYLKCGYKT